MTSVKKAPGHICRPALIILTGYLPEKVADDVDDATAAEIDQQHIVIISHPTISTISGRQAVLPWIIDPVARTIIARSE